MSAGRGAVVGSGMGTGSDRCHRPPAELCRKYSPANFSQFYYPYWTKNSLLCVTNCTLNVPGTIDCGTGLCRVTLDGPRCL